MVRGSGLCNFKRGDHTCVFYHNDDDLLDVLTPYVAEGLRRGERCFCVQKVRIAKRLLYELRLVGADVDGALKSGALELHTEDNVYLPQGHFEPQALVDRLCKSIDEAVKQGYSGLRTAGELSWAVKGRDECDRLIGYEQLVQAAWPGRPAVGICQYPMSQFPAHVLGAVLAVHQRRILAPKPGSGHSSLEMVHGDYRSEIVADRSASSHYYYVVRQHPSAVVGWGVASSYDVAAEAATSLIKRSQHYRQAT